MAGGGAGGGGAPAGSEAGWHGFVVGAGSHSRVRSLPPVTPLTAQRHATVFACCSVIAGDLAKVPLHLYQRGATGREARVRDHALPYLLNVEAVPGVVATRPGPREPAGWTARAVSWPCCTRGRP